MGASEKGRLGRPLMRPDMKITGSPAGNALRKDGRLIGVIGALISTQALAPPDRPFRRSRIGAYVLTERRHAYWFTPPLPTACSHRDTTRLLPRAEAIGDPFWLPSTRNWRRSEPAPQPDDDFRQRTGDARPSPRTSCSRTCRLSVRKSLGGCSGIAGERRRSVVRATSHGAAAPPPSGRSAASAPMPWDGGWATDQRACHAARI